MRCRALAFCSGATAAAMKSGRPARWNAIARSIQTTRVKIVDVALLPRFRLCRGSLSWNIGGSASGSFFAAAVAFARTLPKKPDAFARASFGRRRSKLSLRSLGVSPRLWRHCRESRPARSRRDFRSRRRRCRSSLLAARC